MTTRNPTGKLMGEMPDWGWLVVAKMGRSWYIDLIDLEL